MESRIDYWKAAPDGYKAMAAVEKYLAQCSVEPKLVHMVKLRVSQMNGCAYCIDMHWKDLRALGESEQRLYGLDAWEESPYYTDRERAALSWVEALTKITDGHAPDSVYEEMRKHFSEREATDLTYAAAMINAWNRLGIGLRSKAGTYQAGKH